ncbi:MAG: SagB/ThcOx family dehydrogenase [Gammaproteobacteria bacterium]
MNDSVEASKSQAETASPEQTVRSYHERSKHHLERYARGPETLDWDKQPEPFRRFSGSPRIQLPYPALVESHPAAGAHGLTLQAVSTLLRHAFGLSAWKAFGPDRWSLRCNPSSGNLHPTEAYLISLGIDDMADGVYHYNALDHALEQRCAFDTKAEHPELLVGLSSIHWREAWKYGERAYRYCQLDTGHALGALRYAAQLCGWTMDLMPWPDPDISTVLGLNRAVDFSHVDTETPELVVRIRFHAGENGNGPMLQELISLSGSGHWQGQASPLGGEPRLSWSVIDDVAEACRQDREWPARAAAESIPRETTDQHSLAQTILRRRSAQAFDTKASMSRQSFFGLLQQLMPGVDTAPWDCWPDRARLHLVLFVHRVEGLAKGLYCLPRHPDTLVPLRESLRHEFEWEHAQECPAGLPLYRLVSADARRAARTLSCHQEIASAGIFSIAMLAEFDRVLEDEGAPAYRHLYWEAGLIGQVLYLAAEQGGYRGTGIGCFFDDAVHETLGIEGSRYQSLYHFTVGTAKEDPRILAFPPYEHLARRQMATLKTQIAELFAKREPLKAALEAGQLPARSTLRELELLDSELSALDSQFKALWDENGGDENDGDENRGC